MANNYFQNMAHKPLQGKLFEPFSSQIQRAELPKQSSLSYLTMLLQI
jgi:hypothetical protein